MPSHAFRAAITALAGATGVLGHGFATSLTAHGESYSGYIVTEFPYQENPPVVAGWATTAKDKGFVGPQDYGSPNIACHKEATPGGGHAVVAAGEPVQIRWDTWPDGHKGPILTYLASCGDVECEKVDKSTLKFFKIDEAGMLTGARTSGTPGRFATDVMRENDLTWTFEIPGSIKAGNYVLRHEIIALHSAQDANGAQNYPQCFNVQVTGSGTETPAGVAATSLYKANDPGIAYSIYEPRSDYPIPGPPLIAGAKGADQKAPASGADAPAIVGGGSGGAAPAPAPAKPTNPAPATGGDGSGDDAGGDDYGADTPATGGGGQPPATPKPAPPPSSPSSGGSGGGDDGKSSGGEGNRSGRKGGKKGPCPAKLRLKRARALKRRHARELKLRHLD